MLLMLCHRNLWDNKIRQIESGTFRDLLVLEKLYGHSFAKQTGFHLLL